MVRSVERDETLGVLRSRENRHGMLDADDLIPRRVHDEQRFAQVGDVLPNCLSFGILHQPSTNRKGTASQCDVGDAVTFDIAKMRLKVV